MRKNDRLSFILAASLLLLVVCFKRIPVLTAFYVESIYPKLSRLLNGFSSLFPFSLYDVLILGLIVWLLTQLIFLFMKSHRRRAWKTLLLGGVTIYCCFYLLWGINYFSSDFYTRNRIVPVVYDSVRFRTFVEDYIVKLNDAYVETVRTEDLDGEVAAGYNRLADEYRLNPVPSAHRNKPMLLGRLYASMGIKGYYGPFLGETHYNTELLPHQKPFTIAHETAHLLGITNEAEANLYAYLLCVESGDPSFRFSGYLSLLPYVLQNVRGNFSEEDYLDITAKLSEPVKSRYTETAYYWRDLYSPFLGAVQNHFYEWYLKGNNIPSGRKNYSEVIGLIQSVDRYRKDNQTTHVR